MDFLFTLKLKKSILLQFCAYEFHKIFITLKEGIIDYMKTIKNDIWF